MPACAPSFASLPAMPALFCAAVAAAEPAAAAVPAAPFAPLAPALFRGLVRRSPSDEAPLLDAARLARAALVPLPFCCSLISLSASPTLLPGGSSLSRSRAPRPPARRRLADRRPLGGRGRWA